MGMINGHEYVDLGLPSGLKWATCNVFASTTDDCGMGYAWGEKTMKYKFTPKILRRIKRKQVIFLETHAMMSLVLNGVLPGVFQESRNLKNFSNMVNGRGQNQMQVKVF